jgi:hypothetical protein
MFSIPIIKEEEVLEKLLGLWLPTSPADKVSQM